MQVKDLIVTGDARFLGKVHQDFQPQIPAVINNLTSDSTTDALSAAQGVEIKRLIDAISTESWTFTLEDGTTVTKAVCVR